MTDFSKAEYISSYISKLLRQKFGRGPQSCQTTLNKKYVVTYIRGFVSPMEELLLEQGQDRYVDHARSVIFNHLLDEVKGVVQVSLEVEVEDYFHDWNFQNNSGILLFSLERELISTDFNTQIDIKSLEAEIGRISLLVEKIPNKIHIQPISPTIYLIERVGILIQIEKALIAKGFAQELKYTKDELEKTYFHRNGRFENIFNRSVLDIFIDWNFKEDKSLMVFILSS